MAVLFFLFFPPQRVDFLNNFFKKNDQEITSEDAVGSLGYKNTRTHFDQVKCQRKRRSQKAVNPRKR